MKTTMSIYREVLEKRLKLKRKKFEAVEKALEDVPSGADKRKYVKLEHQIEELETVLDIADSLSEMEGKDGKVQQKDS